MKPTTTAASHPYSTPAATMKIADREIVPAGKAATGTGNRSASTDASASTAMPTDAAAPGRLAAREKQAAARAAPPAAPTGAITGRSRSVSLDRRRSGRRPFIVLPGAAERLGKETGKCRPEHERDDGEVDQLDLPVDHVSLRS